MLVLVGDHGKDQVANLYQILNKCTPLDHPSRHNNNKHNNNSSQVLWCYKKDLGFSTHRKKRMKKLKRDKARGLLNETTTDNFELFVTQTNIQWCYYKDSHRVLGTTVQMLVLQDFEALTPNLMARTIETVCGGGLVIFLLRTVKSLKQLYAMSMDVHNRYRTEANGDVVPRFNERFILSLAKNSNCLVCDDELNVLPLSQKNLLQLTPSKYPKGEAGDLVMDPQELRELQELQESLTDTPHVGALVQLTKTLDQAKALLVFLDACSEKNPLSTSKNTTVAMTAARGRGKSAALGLCLAGAISLGYSQVTVTAPAPENLVAVFDFCTRGLEALNYREHTDYTIKYNDASGREAIKCIMGIHLHRTHRQVVQYIAPDETDKFASAEIVAIDEAAAIPLPIVRKLMKQQQGGGGDRLTFLSSTVNGYEGTGRALSLKLINELRDSKGGRKAEILAVSTAVSDIKGSGKAKGDEKIHEKRWAAAAAAISESGATRDRLTGSLREIELLTPIRYGSGDPVEKWLNKLLCLDTGSTNLKLTGGAPAPSDCELYSVDRDALFSFHSLSEAFLQKLMGLYTSAHYKNTPNDLQMLSDAPAHSLFVLLSPSAENDSESLPDILAVVQVALEGKISKKSVEAQLARGHRSAGDLIPWTIAQQFGDSKFAQLSGARIVRIATHPSVQGMGYGSRAIELLYRFYNGEIISLDNAEVSDDESEEKGASESDDESQGGNGILKEKLKPRKELPPLLLPLTELDAPRLDWVGTSFGLTLQLHKFWTRSSMKLLYLRQTKNDLTGEHSAIMVRALPKSSGVDDSWLNAFTCDTKRRLLSLYGGPFKHIEVRLALALLENLDSTSHLNDETRSGGSSKGKLSAEEIDIYLTPHDIKRLELYGRNLCDHHLITDLLPTISRLYFEGRFGSNSVLSSVQAALFCGIGLQHKDVDSLASDLGIPMNQTLAMFNKAVRKVSIVLNDIVEDKEKQGLVDNEERRRAESAVERMRDVAEMTLEEDAADAANEAIAQLKAMESALNLPPEIAQDEEIMQYVVKGSDKQWEKALEGKDLGSGTKTVQIHSSRPKRAMIEEEESNNHSNTKKPKKRKNDKKSKK